MIIRQIKITNGFSLLEVIVALGVITMGILGVFSLVTQTTQVQTANKNHLIGSMLAQEGIELVRNIKDENYLSLVPGTLWNEDISAVDSTFVIDYRGRDFLDRTPNIISEASTKLYFDAATGFYTHVVAINQTTPFRRLITIDDISASSTVVSCLVNWNDHGRSKDYVAETELHDWR